MYPLSVHSRLHLLLRVVFVAEWFCSQWEGNVRSLYYQLICGVICMRIIIFNYLRSYYLRSISKPGRSGPPSIDLSDAPEAQVAIVSSDEYSCVKMALELTITKGFNHYTVPFEITDTIRATFEAKLWRIRKSFSTLGGQQWPLQLSKWKDGPEANWMFTINEIEDKKEESGSTTSCRVP